APRTIRSRARERVGTSPRMRSTLSSRSPMFRSRLNFVAASGVALKASYISRDRVFSSQQGFSLLRRPPMFTPDRRSFLCAAGAATFMSVSAGGLGRAFAADPAPTGPFTLPDLPYKPDALEPHIDAATMGLHHDK